LLQLNLEIYLIEIGLQLKLQPQVQ